MIGSRINRASPKEAFAAIGGYALVLDMTVRDFQVFSLLFHNLVTYRYVKKRTLIPMHKNLVLIIKTVYYRMS